MISLFLQLKHVRVIVSGDDDDRRIITMTFGFGECSIFEVSIGRVDVVEDLSLKTSIFRG